MYGEQQQPLNLSSLREYENGKKKNTKMQQVQQKDEVAERKDFFTVLAPNSSQNENNVYFPQN